MSILPKFSVVIPLYNKAATIERAIRSVLRQTFQDFEIIVVNDGSGDSGPEIVKSIPDPRIRFFEQSNLGVSAARNSGIAAAHAKFIAFLDADDEWEIDFLREILRLANSYPHAAVYSTSYREWDGAEHHTRPRIRGLPRHPWDGLLPNYFRIAAVSDPPVWTSATVVSRSAILAIGGFPLGVTSGEDLLTWARLAVHYPVAYSTYELASYRRDQTTEQRLLRYCPDDIDYVGIALAALVSEVPSRYKKDLRHYISNWHKMRAHTFMIHGRIMSVLLEACKSLFFCPFNWKVFVYLIMAALPKERRISLLISSNSHLLLTI